MLLGTDELTILRGSKFYGTWQWVNSVTGDPEDFAGLSATIKIKNIHEDFEDIKNVFEVGTAIIEPLDVDGNATKGRVDVSLSKADTLNFTIPQSEDDKYGESGFYAILEILLSTGEVILQAKVRIVESLESETLDFLLDERDEAIIINGKLDNILLRNDEYISTRDNLIDVVIPTTVQTITDLAADIQINKDEITLTKEDVLLMKDNVQNNKDSVESMKLAIETIFDNFDDRFLGVFNEDPLLDNDGEVLKEGTIYYNSIDKELKFYNSVSWDNPTAAAQTYALQASQSASDALTSKDASKLSEDNAKLSEEAAIAKANAILNLTVKIETLAPNELATSNYDATTGILTIKVPKGEKGEKGDSFIFEDFTPEQLSSLSASIIESNIPDLPITKITNLESTLNNKLNITDIQNTLLSIDTTKPLAAYQGKILKDLIDNINTILTSDDTTLDEMQEVVNFIKQNKTDLQNLSISNIAGLEDALQNVSVDFLITPTITTPIDLSIDFQGSITSSSFATASNYNGTQDYVQYQAARDINFTDIVAEYSGSSNLTSWTPSLSIPLTKIYLRVRHGSQSHLSKWSNTISVTTINQGINTPTITTPINNATNQLKNVVINSSAFSVFGGLAETHLSSTWEVSTDINFTNIISQSLNNTTNKTSWTTGNLSVSTTYYARVKYKTITYESAYSPTISFTTKAVFTPTIGVQGAKGFGVAPTDEPFALLGLAEMTGTNTEGHDNYGNYIHTNGSIVCWCPKAYYRVGNAASPRYATYSVNALDIVGTDVYTTEAAANAAGYVLPRAFINAGAEKSGFFIDKYMNSKDGTTSSKSVFGGVPISLATTAGYTVSNGMTGCTGILADAVVLAKSRGARWNTALAFQYAYLAMVSVAQGQAATSTANCAWYDAAGTTNFPKGCNNNALSDVNDTTVTYLTAGDTGNANKPKTGATANFAKTTHNGSMNGVADLNGGMYEVSIGITNEGTTATATTAIATDTIYTLKTTIDHASLTGSWNTANDVWGDATNLATKYNAVTSPHPLGSVTGTVYWGNAANAVFPADATGVNRDICGFIPKNSTASSATGINMLGNNYFYKYNRNNMTPLCCGYWGAAAGAGLFYRYFNYYRSVDSNAASFRASAYFA